MPQAVKGLELGHMTARYVTQGRATQRGIVTAAKCHDELAAITQHRRNRREATMNYFIRQPSGCGGWAKKTVCPQLISLKENSDVIRICRPIPTRPVH